MVIYHLPKRLITIITLQLQIITTLNYQTFLLHVDKPQHSMYNCFLTVDAINNSLSSKQKEVVCRPTSTLEYGCRKDYIFTYTPSVPSGLSVSVYPLYVCMGRRSCPSLVRLLSVSCACGGGGGLTPPCRLLDNWQQEWFMELSIGTRYVLLIAQWCLIIW